MTKKPKPEDDYEVIFVARITLRNGKVLYAHECGLKAFPIRVKKDKGKSRKK